MTGVKYSEVIVFVVGGGSYSEYFNLQVRLSLLYVIALASHL